MKYLLLFTAFLLLISCNENNNGNAELAGQWEGADWIVNGQSSGRDASQVVFAFQPDGSYTASFGAQTEAGSYRLEGNKLYTNAEGQAEKMVQIRMAGADTLRMDMNRAGTPEVLVLVRP